MRLDRQARRIDVQAVFDAILALFSDENRYTTVACAVDKTGLSVDVESPRAHAFNLAGAIQAACRSRHPRSLRRRTATMDRVVRILTAGPPIPYEDPSMNEYSDLERWAGYASLRAVRRLLRERRNHWY